MVRIKFCSHLRIPTASSTPSSMASEDVANVSMGHKESSMELLDATLGDEEPIVLMEVTSEPDARFEESDASGDTDNSGDASDNGGRVKIGADAALAGISFDFGRLKVTKGSISDLESSSRFFPKGFAWPPSTESIPVPNEDVAVVFDDFFTAGLHIPPHPALLDILHKFQVQLHQLTPSAIVHISKFIWAVTSSGGCPNDEVFAHHYELHYQNKKIHHEGSETKFATQFGCISFHLSRFGNHTRLTEAMRNKWTSGWDSHWFYFKVPSEQGKDFKG
jgi:hypothetical protein